MRTEKNISEGELAQLQQAKDRICVSIIIPTHRLFLDRKGDQIRLERAIKSAKQQLVEIYGLKEVEPLTEEIDRLYSMVDFNHNQDGLGLFVSQNIQLIAQFPFSVFQKVVVGESFSLREVLLKESYALPYYVLHVTQKKARLFKAEIGSFIEIVDKNFPFNYCNDYEYNPPSRGSSYVGNTQWKDFEKDKSISREIRYKTFLKEIDALLDIYLTGNIPLIVCGVRKEESYFLNLTKHLKHLAGILTGNYDYKTERELAELVWPYFKSYVDQKNKEVIEGLVEKRGEGLLESGIQDVWMAVKEGRGQVLLIEQNYSVRGFVDLNGYRLTLLPPGNAHTVLTDATDRLVELILQKGGKVIVVESGSIEQYDHVALITQY